jgi:hypothetical protein
LFLSVAVCADSAFADAEFPEQFDLMCKSYILGTTPETPTSGVFTTHFRIDLKENAFCTGEYCGVFSERNDHELSFVCEQGPDKKLCGRETGSTAGPFVKNERFSIQRTSYGISFRRSSAGTGGDIAPMPFSFSYFGRCELEPFTGLSKSEGGAR